MNTQRRKVLKGLGAAGAAIAAQPTWACRRSRRTGRCKIGIIAPKAGIAGTIGECGLRGTMFAVERINAAGGIAGRKVELVVEEETNPKDSIERLRKLVLQDKVDCVQGIVSSGVSLAMGAVAEEMKALLIFWDGTTQDGVKETMPNPRYVFRSTDNECEAVMGSLLAIKHWKGKFATDRRHQPRLLLRPQQLRRLPGAAEEVRRRAQGRRRPVAEGRHARPHLARRGAEGGQARPDLLVAAVRRPADLHEDGARRRPDGRQDQVRLPGGRLPAHAAEEGVHARGHDLRPQHAVLQPRQRDAAAELFVQEYEAKYKDYPHWEADRAYFAMQIYRAGVEAAYKAKNAWPGQEDIINAMEGHEGRVARRPGRDAQGPHRRADLLPGHDDAQEPLRLRDPHRRRRRCTPTSCRSRPASTSGSGSRRRNIKL